MSSSRPDLSAARNISMAPPPPQQKRPDMRGPTDISNILSGLKTKSVSLQEPVQHQSQSQPNEDKTSTISISDLKELQNDNLPHKSKRRQRSDKNTVSLALDI
jgi:hypothetical protein